MAHRNPKLEKPKVPSANEEFVQALRAGSYSALRVSREGRQCCLIMRRGHEERVFVNRKGDRPDYHHAWQIRGWLLKEFGIPAKDVPVRVES